MFSTRFFEVYLNKSDFSTENSFAYYDYYFLFLMCITWLVVILRINEVMLSHQQKTAWHDTKLLF